MEAFLIFLIMYISCFLVCRISEHGGAWWHKDKALNLTLNPPRTGVPPNPNMAGAWEGGNNWAVVLRVGVGTPVEETAQLEGVFFLFRPPGGRCLLRSSTWDIEMKSVQFATKLGEIRNRLQKRFKETAQQYHISYIMLVWQRTVTRGKGGNPNGKKREVTSLAWFIVVLAFRREAFNKASLCLLSDVLSGSSCDCFFKPFIDTFSLSCNPLL